MTKFKLLICDKNKSEDYSQITYISSDLDKTPAKFHTDPAKIVEGVAFLRSQDTQCLYALVDDERKND